MKVWSYSLVQQVTAKSDFSFKELRTRGDAKPVTIYLVVPFEALSEYRALLRVMIGSCMHQIREAWSAAEDDKRPPVMLYLDEFPQLHCMEPIEEALLYMRSYSCRFWFFCQSVENLQRHYQDTWRSFIANCGTKCFYGVDDIETAKLVSEMSGTATVRDRSYNASVSQSDTVGETTTRGGGSHSGYSSGPGGGTSSSGSNSCWSRSFSTSRTLGNTFGTGVSFIGRPLFMPDEVLRMPFGSMIAFSRGLPAIRAQLRFWFEDPEFRRRAMIPPPSA
jgi:type IV secretion system protein VirD4